MSWEDIKKNLENNGKYVPDVPKKDSSTQKVVTNNNQNETGMKDFLGELLNRGKKLAINSTINELINPTGTNFFNGVKKNIQRDFREFMTNKDKQLSIWERVQNVKNGNEQNQNKENLNTTPDLSSLSPEKRKELEDKLAQFKNSNATVSQNNKDITKRETNIELNLPEVQIANKQYEEQKQNGQIESIDKLVKDYKAQEKAKEINEKIDKGGADAVNAVIENTLTNFKEGTMGAIGNMANVPLILGSGYADSIEKATNDFSNITNTKKANTDRLSNFKNSLLNEADRIGNKYTEFTNANQYIKNDAVKTAGSVSNTIGNMLPSIVSNILLPGSRSICTRIICRRENSFR